MFKGMFKRLALSGVMAVVMSLIAVNVAMANPVMYTDTKFSTVPESGITKLVADVRNCTITKSSDIIMEKSQPSTYPNRQYLYVVPTKNNSTGKYTYNGNGWIKYDYSNAGWDWTGRKINLSVKIDQISVQTEKWALDNGTRSMVSYIDVFGFEMCGAVDRRPAKATQMRVTLDVTYADDGSRCPYGFGIYFVDIDVNLSDVRERVELKQGFNNPVYIAGNGGSNLDVNSIVNNNIIQVPTNFTGGNTTAYDTNAFTMISSYPAVYVWGGNDCGTDFRPMSPVYPYGYVGNITKANADGVQFDGERMKFTGEFFVPYCDVSPVNPNDINCQPRQLSVVDVLDAGLDASSVQVKMTNDKGQDVTSQWTVSTSGQMVTIANHYAGTNFPMGRYKIEISAKVRPGFDWSKYTKVSITGGEAFSVPNKLSLRLTEQYTTNAKVTKESNVAHGKVSYGWIEVDLSSANDSVSQLGENGCYSLAGAQIGIYNDEACTQRVGTLTLDTNGYGKSDRLKLGDYWLGEIKTPNGFASNETIDSSSVAGLKISLVERENVPQSEDLDGSIISKRDSELQNAGYRKNPILAAMENLPLM